MSFKVGDIVIDLCDTNYGEGYIINTHNCDWFGVRFYSVKYLAPEYHHTRRTSELELSPTNDTPLRLALRELEQ